MSEQEAIAWCVKYDATVYFYSGVRVRIAGWQRFQAHMDTFVEAVVAVKQLVDESDVKP